MDDKWVGRKQAAQILEKSERTIYNLARKGLIRTTQIGGRLKYHVDDLQQYNECATILHEQWVPINRYSPHNTFVVWIQFNPDACEEWNRIERWCRDIETLVREYVEERIEPRVQENALRRGCSKLLVYEILAPVRRQTLGFVRQGGGHQRQFQTK